MTTIDAEKISFRKLTDADLPRMVTWAAQDFVRRWWYDLPTTLDAMHDEYLPLIRGEDAVTPYVILYDAMPIGYIQSYPVTADSGDPESVEYAQKVNVPDAAAADLFIGEPDYVYRGYGAPILRRFAQDVIFGALNASIFVISPAETNTSAIRAYEKAGFIRSHTITLSTEPHPEVVMLLRCETPDTLNTPPDAH